MKINKILAAVLMAASVALAACGGDSIEADIKALNAVGEKMATSLDMNSLMSKVSAAQTNQDKAKLLKEMASSYEGFEKEISNVSISSTEIKQVQTKFATGFKQMKDGILVGATALEANDQAGVQKMNEGLMAGAKSVMEAGVELQKIASEKKIDLTKK